MNRQKKTLLSLFGLFLLAIIYAYWMMPEQQRLSPQHKVTRAEASGNSQKSPDIIKKNVVRIDLLEKDTADYRGAKRDIFNFAVIPRKPVVKPKPIKTVVKPQIIQKRPPAVTPVVRQQLARFTLYGFLLKEEALTVFLSRGDEIFLVHEGDQFGDDKQFTALSITREKMVINQTNDSRNIEIILVEKEPLVPVIQQPSVTSRRQPDMMVSQQPDEVMSQQPDEAMLQQTDEVILHQPGKAIKRHQSPRPQNPWPKTAPNN